MSEIEIPEIWSECEINSLSRRTRELLVAVMEAAGFNVSCPSEDAVLVTPNKDSNIPSFKRVLDTVQFNRPEETIRFSKPEDASRQEAM